MCNKYQVASMTNTADSFMPESIGTIGSIKESILQKKSARTKLWQFDHNYHCAVIGTCLTMTEVKKLLNSLGINCNQTSAYDIHTAIVTLIAYNDRRSKKVQNYLDKKFSTFIKITKKMDATLLRKEWKSVLNTGDLVGTFWAIMSHPATDSEMKRDFYGDIHMLSHLSGASNRVDLKRLNQLEIERKKVDSDALVQQKKINKIQAENTRLQQKIQLQEEKSSDFNNRIIALTNANEQLTILNDIEEIKRLNLQVSKLNHKVAFHVSEMEKHEESQKEMGQLLTILKYQAKTDKQCITEYKNEIEHLQYVLNQNKSQNKCLFKKQGLCGQCVLYVGGKANLIPHYRELIEAKSGHFLYHDGGLEKSTQDLPQFLNRADLVIFPSDCISHDAYWKIKTICKKQQKPYEYLNSPGLHSLSKALDSVVHES
jgi:hypothetical protein